MTLLLSALLFSFSSNLDNVVIGMAYGIKKIKINFISNLIIALITCTGTFLSMSLGYYINLLLSSNLSNFIGSGAIIILGLYFTIQSLIKLVREHHYKSIALKDINEMVDYAVASDQDHSGDLNLKETLIVAFSLTFNNLGTGIGASIAGVNIFMTVCCTFIISLVTIYIGMILGSNVVGRFMGKYAPLISGLIFITLGVLEIFN